MKGTITTIKREKGYGFIRDEEGHDRMFHASGQDKSCVKFAELQTGSLVEFVAYQETVHPITGRAFGPGDGLRASNVRVASTRPE